VGSEISSMLESVGQRVPLKSGATLRQDRPWRMTIDGGSLARFWVVEVCGVGEAIEN
jgi:hypothetical protein